MLHHVTIYGNYAAFKVKKPTNFIKIALTMPNITQSIKIYVKLYYK